MAEFVLLGSAQDGGLPHAGCGCVQCSRARSDDTFQRRPAAAGVVSGQHRLLIDATSAFAEQEQMLWESVAKTDADAERHSPPECVLITHAHTGHYAGLWQLDRSVMSARGVRVVGPPLTIQLLAQNEPWLTMQHEGFITLEPLPFDIPHELLAGIHVTLLSVPHRSEWGTDTAAVRIAGPDRAVLYLPDIDQWDDWDVTLDQVVASVDAAFLDGTFWDRPPRPGVPHPPVQETMDRLQHVVCEGRTSVSFIHLNHSNPLVDADSEQACSVRERRFHIGREGDCVPL